MRRALVPFAVAVLACGPLAGGAWAHARLLRVEPPDRAVLARAPRAVRFVFDDTVRTAPGIAAVRNGGGSVLGGKARAEGKELVVPLRAGLQDGDYTIRWRVISDDGHEIGGVVAFAVGTGRSPPAPGLSAGSTGPGGASIVARWLFFLGLLAGAGIAVFHLVVWRVETVEGADQDRERRAGSVLLAGCLSLAVLGALLLLLLSHATFETRFGRVVTAAAIAAGIGLVAALAAVFVRIARPPALLAALFLLPLPTLAGHALDPGQSRLDLVVDVAHVTAAAVWLGGLLSLIVVVPRAAPGQEARRALAYRFSSLALASVALLVGTGIWRAFAELSAVSQLWSTGYGRAILVKSALLALTLALAVRTRYVLLGGAFGRLRLGVAGETVVLLGVIVAVAFLTSLPPGRVSASAAPPPRPAAPVPPRLPSRDAVVLAREDGRLAVALAARPAGERTALQATVVGPSNTGVNGLDVSFDGISASACGSGCYETLIPPTPVVSVKVSGRTLRFRLPARSESAQGLVRRATAAFRALRSVTYVERLSSRPGISVVSLWKLAAPNRLSYAIPGGAAGIVIGPRRWDRSSPRRGWRESATSPLRMPAPVWGFRTSNAHVIRADRSVLVVSLLNRSLPAWFTIRFDRRTLHPRSLDMSAAAHFMHHRYTSFNRPAGIRAPGASR